MVEQLRSAGDQLRAAWDHYLRVYSTLLDYHPQKKTPCRDGFPPELAHQLDAELSFISSYEPKIREIKVTISRTRNYSSGLAPINALSPEILTCVFDFALAQPCNIHRTSNNNEIYYPKYPDDLIQVCSFWRRTALSYRPLWSHIDLSSSDPGYVGLLTRAETHVARAGNLPLEIHVSDCANYSGRTESGCSRLYELVSHIASRVQGLEFVVNSRLFRDFHRSLFYQLLSQQPPILRRLTIRSEHGHRDSVIHADHFDSDEPEDEPEDESHDLVVSLTEERIETAFAPLAVLHLRGIFPEWSSRAYHHLVDLRLLSAGEWSSIEDLELVTILASSPGLRILHFGLLVVGPSTDLQWMGPKRVHLQDLQVVKIFPFEDEHKVLDTNPTRLLQFLAPGIKPLRLSFSGCYEPSTTFISDLKSFFSRSRVARFCTRGVLPPMSVLLRHAARLELVTLDSFESYAGDETSASWLEVDSLGYLPRLSSLRITRSRLFESDFRLLLQCCPNGTVLHSSFVDHDDLRWPTHVALTTKELSDAFPNVGISEHTIHSSDDPTADWDILQ